MWSTRLRTRQNFELLHIIGPVQNFGPPARNFGPLRAEFAWREWRKTLGGHVANWAGLSGFSPRENKISHTFFIDFINKYSKVSNRSRPNQIAGPGPKSGPARKSESRGPENGVSRWRRPNSDIYSQNHHFGLVYDMIYQFLGMEAKNYKFGMFCQQCHPSVASGDADIRPRNTSRIHTSHLFTS